MRVLLFQSWHIVRVFSSDSCLVWCPQTWLMLENPPLAEDVRMFPDIFPIKTSSFSRFLGCSMFDSWRVDFEVKKISVSSA